MVISLLFSNISYNSLGCVNCMYDVYNKYKKYSIINKHILGTDFPLIGLWADVIWTGKSVTHGQCDDRPSMLWSITDISTSIKLYCLVTEARVCMCMCDWAACQGLYLTVHWVRPEPLTSWSPECIRVIWETVALRSEAFCFFTAVESGIFTTRQPKPY